MNIFRQVKGFVSGMNKATLSGALDVIAVDYEDGTCAATPFHVRFGKLQVLHSLEKRVNIYVNGEKVDVEMMLGEAGEAYFIVERELEDPEPPQLLPLPTDLPADVPALGEGLSVSSQSDVMTPVMADLADLPRSESLDSAPLAPPSLDGNASGLSDIGHSDTEGDAKAAENWTWGWGEMPEYRGEDGSVHEPSEPPHPELHHPETLPPSRHRSAHGASSADGSAGDDSGADAASSGSDTDEATSAVLVVPGDKADRSAESASLPPKSPRLTPIPERRSRSVSLDDQDMPPANSFAPTWLNDVVFDISLCGDKVDEFDAHSMRYEECVANPNIFLSPALRIRLMCKWCAMVRDPPHHFTVDGRNGVWYLTWAQASPIMAVVATFKQSEEPVAVSVGPAVTVNSQVPGQQRQGWLEWMRGWRGGRHHSQPPVHPVPLDAEAAAAAAAAAAASGTTTAAFAAATTVTTTPGSSSVPASPVPSMALPAGTPGSRAVPMTPSGPSSAAGAPMSPRSGVDPLILPPATDAIGVQMALDASDTDSIETFDRSRYRCTLRASSAQLAAMKLKPGENTIMFEVATGMQRPSVSARLFLWSRHSKIVVSDVDGTITKSDMLGHLAYIVGRDWTHEGVAQLFTSIQANGYNLVYLTSRAIGQTVSTRGYLENINQENIQLPVGPVITSPDRLFTAFKREVIDRRPQEFKIAALKDIQHLFPAEFNPFYAGFGNRPTDVAAYRSVNIPMGKIFIINPQGEVRPPESVRTYLQSYRSLVPLVDAMFPPLADAAHPTAILRAQDELYNDANYWGRKYDLVSDDESDDDDQAGLSHAFSSAAVAPLPAVLDSLEAAAQPAEPAAPVSPASAASATAVSVAPAATAAINSA